MPLRHDPRFLEGIALFNRGQWFEAHEVWEDLWRQASGQGRPFLQGLIQAAVALEHARQDNPRGAQRMLERCRKRWEGLPPVMMGIDLAKVLTDLKRALAPVVEASGTAHPNRRLEMPPVRITVMNGE